MYLNDGEIFFVNEIPKDSDDFERIGRFQDHNDSIISREVQKMP